MEKQNIKEKEIIEKGEEEFKDSLPNNKSQNIITKILSNITIEPALFLTTFAKSVSSVSFDQMLIEKTCKVDFEFNDTVCDNILDDVYEDENTLVQNEVAQYHVYAVYVYTIFPAFFAFYLGAWADLFGRKILIYMGIGSNIIKICLTILCAYFFDTSKYYLLAAEVPVSLTGGFYGWMIAINAFLSDITEPENRAFRYGMLHIITSLGSPIASPIGAYLLKKGGYICVFSTELTCFILGALILIWRLHRFKWSPPKTTVKRSAFSPLLIKDSFKAALRQRHGPNRKYILIFIALSVFHYVPFYGESTISYLYVRTRFGWGVDEYSNYRIADSVTSIAGQAIFIPLVKFLKINEGWMMTGIFISETIRCLVKGLAYKGWMYYVGGMIDLLGSYAMSIARAMLSCCVPANELGKVYSLMTFIEAIAPLGVVQVYASVWKATSETYPGTCFFISTGLSIIALALAFYVHISLKGKKMEDVTAIGAGRESLPTVKNNGIFDKFYISRI